MGAFAELGFCYAWPPGVVSAGLNLCHSTIDVGGWGGVYNFLASVSSQQKFETTDGPVLQPGVIASNGSVLLPCVSSSDRPVLQLNFI